MYYVEFYRPKSDVSHETFRSVVEETNQQWFAGQPDDRLNLRLARTWRLGHTCPYITIVEIDQASRLDEWTTQCLSDLHSRDLIDRWLGVLDCDACLYEDFGNEQL